MCSGNGLVTKYGEMELAMSVQEMDMSQNMARWSWPWVVRRWTCENFGEMELAMGCQEMDLSKSSGDGGNIFLTARWTFLFLARWSWPWVVRRWSQEMEWRDGVGHGLSGDGVARWTREMELAMHVQEMEWRDGVDHGHVTAVAKWVSHIGRIKLGHGKLKLIIASARPGGRKFKFTRFTDDFCDNTARVN